MYKGQDRSRKTVVDEIRDKENTMNLPDLAQKVAKKNNLSHIEAANAVKLIFKMFSEAMKKGDRIEIRGFGSFAMRDYKTYTGRNPKTGQGVEVKPKRLPYFKVGKELREFINLL